MPQYLIGSATAVDGTVPTVVAHIVNDIGKWGSGFVVPVGRRWPKAELQYRKWANGSLGTPLRIGLVQIVSVEPNIWVANMCAQHKTRKAFDTKSPPPIRYGALESTLAKVASFAIEHGATVSMPRIGADRAGGSWKKIEALIEKTMGSKGLTVIVYDLTEQAAASYAEEPQQNIRPTDTPTARRA